MEFLNRQAIIIKPRKPFVDWIRQVDIDAGREPLPASSLSAHSNIYLISHFDTSVETTDYVRSRAVEIFEHEVGEWYPDPDLWPEKRNWTTFQRWFKWEICEMIYDLEDSAVEPDYLSYSVGGEFRIDANLFDEEGWIDPDQASEWAENLYDRFRESPEAEHFLKEHGAGNLGWGIGLFDFLHGYENQTIQQLTPATFEFALMGHFPRKVMDPDLDAVAVIEEFQALFAFLAREYGLESGAKCLEYIEKADGLAEEFEAAMSDESKFGMAKSFMTAGLSAGFDMTSNEGIERFTEIFNTGARAANLPEPFRDDSPDIGRNDPCLCGSGKKYKKCCMRVD